MRQTGARKANIERGWPQRKDQVPPEIRPYWNFRDEITSGITFVEEILFKRQKLIVPTS